MAPVVLSRPRLPCTVLRVPALLVLLLAVSDAANNPYEKGCLFAKNLTKKVRVCGSEDHESVELQGKCRTPPMGYPEIRLVPQDWESVSII